MTSQTNYLSLRIGREEFLILSTNVRAVVPLGEMTPGMHPLEWVVGTVHVAGWDAQVINLRERLGIPIGPSSRKPMIVVVQMHRKEGPHWLGVVAEYAGDPIQLSTDEPRNGVVQVAGRLKRVIDLDALLSASDLRALLNGASDSTIQ